MFIRAVDQGLERLLRATLPLPEDAGDVTFEAPTGNWAASLSRLTVNLFLYDVTRCTRATQLPVRRVTADGRAERRPAQPMFDLSYLISAWAGSARDEHQLLGDVISRLSELTVLPPEHLPASVDSTVTVSLGSDENNRLREIWTAAGGQLKASVTVRVTAAADAFGWRDEPTAVTAITGSALPRPRAAK